MASYTLPAELGEEGLQSEEGHYAFALEVGGGHWDLKGRAGGTVPLRRALLSRSRSRNFSARSCPRLSHRLPPPPPGSFPQELRGAGTYSAVAEYTETRPELAAGLSKKEATRRSASVQFYLQACQPVALRCRAGRRRAGERESELQRKGRGSCRPC